MFQEQGTETRKMTRNTYHFQMVAHKLEGKNNKVCRAVKARGFWSPGHISPHIFSKKNLSLSLSKYDNTISCGL